MQLTINSKDYTFKFGLRFVRELEKTVHKTENGVEFGVGTSIKMAQLILDRDLQPLALL